MKHVRKWWFALLSVAMIGCVVIVLASFDEPTLPTKSEPPQPPEQAITLYANVLAGAYLANEPNAEKTVGGKLVDVVGQVSGVRRDGKKFAVILHAETDPFEVKCLFNDDSQILDLNPADRVTIQGRCVGIRGGLVTLIDCHYPVRP